MQHHQNQQQGRLKTRHFKHILYIVLLVLVLYPFSYIYAALSCSVTTAAACTGGSVVLLRMSGSTNAHAELPSQSNANYASNVVCCSSASAIGNSCSGNFQRIGRLSAVTNAHVQQTSVNTYGSSVCLSDTSVGDTVTVGYQNTNCNNYDATLYSMSATTNATVGDGSAYTIKACAKIVPILLTFSVSTNAVGFGTLSSSGPRYATTSGGNGTEIEAHTISASTNASSGYSITVNGATLTSGTKTIAAIGATNTASSTGTPQFGLRANITSGTGAVSAPYAASGFALDTASFPDEVATGAGDSTTTVYSVRYVGNISPTTAAGTYTSNLTYVVTGTF
jgi:hypothetical protein